MRMTLHKDVFIIKCAYEEREIPKSEGFLFDAKHGIWYTRHLRIAARLREYADDKAIKLINSKLISYSPWACAIPYPDNLTPYPFQIERAVPFALARNRSYLGLSPGLGKTICAGLIINALFIEGVIKKVIYICPPFLAPNVMNELERWLVHGLSPVRVKPADYEDALIHNVAVLPDSLLSTRKGRATKVIEEFLNAWVGDEPALLIIDEAHRFKTDTSQRSESLFETFMPRFERVVFMSGTPMPNRPMELFSVLNAAAPEIIDFRNRFEYGIKYCGGHKDKFGWKFDGATNMKELIPRIKEKFLLRIRKDEVLPDLPPKTESMVFIDANYPAKLVKLERDLLKAYSPDDVVKHQLGDEHISTYRKLLGELKVDSAIEYIEGLLDGGDTILVFAHHIDVVDSLKAGLSKYNPLVIAGYVPSDERMRRAERFQKGETQVLILNIQAGGIGFNLTRANTVVFVEFSWTPSDNEQAIDRAHRIGQENPVTAHYLVYRNSLDAKILGTNLSKQTITKRL